jgi:hypothetical protein
MEIKSSLLAKTSRAPDQPQLDNLPFARLSTRFALLPGREFFNHIDRSVNVISGFETAVVVETSPDNFQAWLNHGRTLSDRFLSTLAARQLAYGRHKAKFLMRFGFSLARKSELAAALRSHGAGCEVTKVETSPFGMRYTVEGKLVTPDGRNPLVRSVWFVEKSEDTPRLVTVYPIGGKRR